MDRHFANEQQNRLMALRATGLLDSPPEASFDALTRLITTVLRVPIALVSLVDHDRQFFKSEQGLSEPVATQRQMPLSHSFCQHVVNARQPLIIPDTRVDPRVCENLAIKDYNVIAYAGVPLVDASGFVLGSICAIDSQPRDWSESDIKLLKALSEQATVEISLRQRSKELSQRIETERQQRSDRDMLTRLDVHDLRTPLSAMVLGLEVLQRTEPLNDTQQSTLALCRRNGRALLNLIDNLTDISALEQRGKAALRLSDVSLRAVALTAIDQVKSLALDKGLDLTQTIDPAVDEVCIDSDKIARVLMHLLANAIRYTPKRGTIELKIGTQSEDNRDVLLLEVHDSGVGISQPHRIFDEGVFVDRHAVQRRSTGMGLSFCKRVIEAHGGQIWLTTEMGVGSVFSFTLPSLGRCRDEKLASAIA